MTENMILTIEDPKTISYEVQDDKIVMSFDGNKQLVIPVKKYTSNDFTSEMVNPSYQELVDEFDEFLDNDRKLHESYNNAVDELSAAEHNHKQSVIAQALGKNLVSDVHEANTIKSNAQAHVETLNQARCNHEFNSVYSKEQIKESYEAAQKKVLERFYSHDKHYADNLQPLIKLIVSSVSTWESSLESLEQHMIHTIYFKRGYEKNFTTQKPRVFAPYK